MQQVLFSLMSAGVSGLLHWFVWRQLAVRTDAQRWVKRAVATVLALSFLGVPLAVWSARLGYDGIAYGAAWLLMPCMVLTALCFVVLLFASLPRWIASGVRKVRRAPAPFDPNRRLFFARASASSAALVATAAVGKGIANACAPHQIETVEFVMPGLSAKLDGLRIVQLTDLHISMTVDATFVMDLVERVNALAPDVVVLTGDMVDGDVGSLKDDAAPLMLLRAKYGVYAITGNHEYYSGADAWIAELSKLGIRYLRNQAVTIGGELRLAGVDDHSAHKYAGHGENVEQALAGWQPGQPLVLLAHQPRQVHTAAKHAVPLVLSGHTHGGQVWPWHYLARLQQGGLLAGRYQIDKTTLYVSRGCGFWGPRVRVLAPLEITEIVLRAPQ